MRRDGRSEGSIEDLVTPRLQRARYPDENLRAEHLPIIVNHAEQAIHALPENASVLEVEHDYEYSYSDGYLADEITVKCRVDLVIEHGDGIVDHIDFKTGAQSGDLIQNFLSRVTVKNNLRDIPSEKLRTVNVMTRDGVYEVVPSDRSVHAATWETVKSAIRDLAEDDEWRARPDPPVCRWCEFNTHCDQADLGSDEESGWDRD